jgi:hypothetical protein
MQRKDPLCKTLQPYAYIFQTTFVQIVTVSYK